MEINHRLKDLREDADKTQKEIAKILQMDQSNYSKYEKSKNMMGIDKYITLAKYYNISIDYLTGLIQEPKPLYSKKQNRKEI